MRTSLRARQWRTRPAVPLPSPWDYRSRRKPSNVHSSAAVLCFKNIKVAIVRADLVEGFIRAVPLIQNFLDHVFIVRKLKPYRPLIRFPPGVASHS